MTPETNMLGLLKTLADQESELKALRAQVEQYREDADIGRQWREDSSLEKWFPLTAERLAKLEQWARDCRDQVLFPAAQREGDIGKAADGLGQSLVEFHLAPYYRAAIDKARKA